jgi:HAD superfamily hydrolase (TIGR01549 family)
MNTIFFDLDGTLLHFHDHEFESLYFKALSKALEDLMDAKTLVSLIWSCTKETVMDLSTSSNEEVFMKALSNKVDESTFKQMTERFERFYETDFDVLKSILKDNSILREAVKILKKKGYRLVIVTNPLFPRLAIEKRIAWTGMDRTYFDYVTSFEDNHYCKPNPQLYEEVLRSLKLEAHHVLMVGNDRIEDMVAGQLGIKTFLLLDYSSPKSSPFIPDHQGTQNQFLDFVNLLPDLV